MKVLVYCLQRSGSNYLQALLKKKDKGVKVLNIDEPRDYPTQKHFRLYNDKNIVPEDKYINNLKFNSFTDFEGFLKKEEVPDYYIIISKSPYSWYKSYLKWAKKCNWPRPKHHYIQEYNLFYSKWLRFSKETNKIIFVKYKNLLIEKKKVLRELQNIMNLEPKTNFGINFSLKKVKHSSWFSKSKKDYYLNNEYLKEYSKGEMERLNSILDESLVKRLGYTNIDF